MKQSNINHYQKFELENEVAYADPHRLVQMLFEGAMVRLSKAKVDAVVEDTPVETEDIPNSEDFPAELSYDAMTLAELREECRARGLPVSGTKAELALRLKRDDEGITESAPTPEAPDEESAAEEEVDAPADEAAATEVEMNAEDTEQEPTAETNE